MTPFDCGDGFFRCADTWHGEVRCFPKSYLCDGKPDCIGGKDEQKCGEEHLVLKLSVFYCNLLILQPLPSDWLLKTLKYKLLKNNITG